MKRNDRAWYNDRVGNITGLVALEAAVHKHTSTHNVHMPSSTSPSCTSRSGVILVCQEAEGGQIYNDSREQHGVTAVNIYTGLTKDVAKVCGGSKYSRKLQLSPHY